ncbi:hypothetical protein BDR06DRAFT_956910 [Suillus hirtellus]|nr:hypothetical protein BDR06DRAFT_956910 [Suillus hirtellus]
MAKSSSSSFRLRDTFDDLTLMIDSRNDKLLQVRSSETVYGQNNYYKGYNSRPPHRTSLSQDRRRQLMMAIQNVFIPDVTPTRLLKCPIQFSSVSTLRKLYRPFLSADLTFVSVYESYSTHPSNIDKLS